ncbi:MAG: zf-HC2 domain-containing protein [Gemmatimonadota bacterium]
MTHGNLICSEFEKVLPDFLEGSLDDSGVADAELHLAACEGCRRLVADIERITREAAALPMPALSRDLWPEIEAKIAARVVPLPAARARGSWSGVRLAALAAGLIAVTAIATWRVAVARLGVAPPANDVAVVPSIADSAPLVDSMAAPARLTESLSQVSTVVAVRNPAPAARVDARTTLDTEIDQLRGVLDDSNNRLDPATRAVIASSLATIDSAIVQARRALAADPESRFLSQQLNRTLEHKLGLLRTAALMAPRT